MVCLWSSQPGVHNQARAGIQSVWLARGIYCVYSVQESGGRNLSWLLGSRADIPRTTMSWGSSRIHRHTICGRHGLKEWVVVPPSGFKAFCWFRGSTKTNVSKSIPSLNICTQYVCWDSVGLRKRVGNYYILRVDMSWTKAGVVLCQVSRRWWSLSNRLAGRMDLTL